MNKNLSPRNTKDKPHGYWECYWDNGELWFKCFFYNGKMIGYEEYYPYVANLIKIYHL